ncbi:MAG: recombinase family protein [Candidatus Omnitrophica bacterium]|nr:recombinase family protein [Candidatus Omnitrophota bacterium]
MRCGLYIRVSTDMQKEKGESLEVQLKRLKAYVDSKEDWIIAEIYKDAGISAKNTNRPEFSRMLEDIEQDKIDAILCTKLDRVFRNTKDFLNTTDDFEKRNIKFVCLEGSIDTSTPAGRVFSTMRAAFAQFERETTAERVRDVMRSRAEEGKWNGGISPFGYYSENKEIKINTEEAKVIKEIYALYLEHRSIRHIVHHFNAGGIKTRRGDLWSPTSIRRMLTNPFYYGIVTYSKRSHTYSGELKRNKKPIFSNGRHPPIISKELFDNVQTIIKEQSKEAPKANAKYLLTGIVYCTVCGSRMHGMANRRSRKVHKYYRCSGYLQKGIAKCKGNAIRVDNLEGSIIGDLKNFSVNSNRLKDALKEVTKINSDNSGVAKERLNCLRNRLAKIQIKKQKIFELYEEGNINKADFLSRKVLAEEEELLVNKEIEALENKTAGTDFDSYDLEHTLGLCKDMKEVYDELDLPDRKELIQGLLTEINVDKHDIKYSIPVQPKFISCLQDSGLFVKSSATGRGSLRLQT